MLEKINQLAVDVKDFKTRNEQQKKIKAENELAATLELSDTQKAQRTVKDLYKKPDIEKLRQIRVENEKRMLYRMMETTGDSFLKQAGGLKKILERLIGGEKIEGFELNLDAQTIEKAHPEVAEDGYWSADSTSSRLVDFAKALSGEDATKAEALMAAIRKGYEKAESLWGDKLPKISQDTLKLTIEKMTEWQESIYPKAE